MDAQFISYISVILPIKWDGEVFYGINSEQRQSLAPGCWVEVSFGKRTLQAVVRRILEWKDLPYHNLEIKSIGKVLEKSPVSAREIRFWNTVAGYYLCSVGEVFKAAYPILTLRQQEVASHRKPEDILLSVKDIVDDITLSAAQQKAYEQIKEHLESKTVLLEGVTGSGKTEIYIKLIDECMAEGKDALYLVPEIAMSNQLTQRLKNHFGQRLLCYHSGISMATKKLIRQVLTFKGTEECQKKPVVVLGTRSSVFLPFENLGLTIVDEEHDQSYKQEDPSPRYNGRDAALLLAQMHGAKVLLGSATPSFESLYNFYTRKFARVLLTEKYFQAPPPEVTVIDTLWTRRSRQMKGSFSQQLLNMIEKTIAEKKQVLVFRSIRSYSPVVECSSCGEALKCPHCNVPLSYHRYDNTLRCHYCEYKAPYTPVCPSCKEEALQLRGAGTEKIEEELRELFPNASVARYDADIAKSKKDSEKVLSDFASGKTDILVGTQMTSKGFDFKGLALVAVIQADTILSQQDFRADEKAMQLFIQLLGRSGRRREQGKLVIQTNQKNHPVIKELLSLYSPDKADGAMMAERSMYCFPPFVRLINIILRDKNYHRLETSASSLANVLKSSRAFCAMEVSGPFTPRLEKLRDEYQLCISVKFAKDARLAQNKAQLKKVIDLVKLPVQVILDVDPS